MPVSPGEVSHSLLSLRRATPDDYAAFTTLFPELHVDDPVPDRHHWVNELAPAAWIAERDGIVVGYCYCQELSGSAYVRHLIVAPQARGRGVGRALMQEVAEHLRARGLKRWCLNVMPGNVPALRLYEAMGLRPLYSSVALRFPWSLAERLPDDTAAVSVRALAPESEARVEGAFRLPPGQLTKHRKPGRVLVEMVNDTSGELVGFAMFDPEFPRAFPFRLKRPTLVGPMLRALRAHALERNPLVNVVIEDDAPLAEALLQAGATVRHEILHLEGEL